MSKYWKVETNGGCGFESTVEANRVGDGLLDMLLENKWGGRVHIRDCKVIVYDVLSSGHVREYESGPVAVHVSAFVKTNNANEQDMKHVVDGMNCDGDVVELTKQEFDAACAEFEDDTSDQR